MNCHNAPFFTDNQFHKDGLTYYGRKYEDLGLYNVTKNPDKPKQEKDPLLSKNDKLLRGIRLSYTEKEAVIAFFTFTFICSYFIKGRATSKIVFNLFALYLATFIAEFYTYNEKTHFSG